MILRLPMYHVVTITVALSMVMHCFTTPRVICFTVIPPGRQVEWYDGVIGGVGRRVPHSAGDRRRSRETLPSHLRYQQTLRTHPQGGPTNVRDQTLRWNGTSLCSLSLSVACIYDICVYFILEHTNTTSMYTISR